MRSEYFIIVALLIFPVELACARTPPPPLVRRYVLAILGDSLSDTGNTFREARVPDANFYWRGRYTDGPNWVDYLQAAIPDFYNLQVFNYAYGAATACPEPDLAAFPFVKNVTSQTQALVADVASGKVPSGSSVKLVPVQWIGNNDILYALTRAAANISSFNNETVAALIRTTVACRMASAQVLAAIPGVKDVVLMPIAPLHSSPGVPAFLKAKVKEIGIMIGQYTLSAVTAFQARLNAANTGVKVHLLGDFSWIEKGFTSVMPPYKRLDDPCFRNPVGGIIIIPDNLNVTICDVPTQYSFYDASHPETRFHRWFAINGFLPRMQQLQLLP